MTWAATWAAGLLLVLALAGMTAEPSLALGVAGAALLVAWGFARHIAGAVAALATAAPSVAARARRRTLAARAVPRQRDPDAAGHTRSRAPSDGLPSRGVVAV